MTRNSPLAAWHEAAGAKTTTFGGWEMPVRFDSIGNEHQAVRDTAGMFDVSHLSRIRVSGPDALAAMEALTTNQVAALDVGDAQYSLILREDGVIIDDIVVYRLEDAFLFMPNAGADSAMADHWRSYAEANGLAITVENTTEAEAMLAVQGPDAVGLVEDLAQGPVEPIERWAFDAISIAGTECLASRTGYTGEDGFELVLTAEGAGAVWEAFIEAGVTPCGLGARDTLRLEAGLLLSGQDFDPEEEPRTPREARLMFAIEEAKGDFVGSDGLDESDEVMVGLELDERAVPRHGYAIEREGESIGHITSGTISPSFDIPIALGYVNTEAATVETELDIAIRDRSIPATVVERNFLQRHR